MGKFKRITTRSQEYKSRQITTCSGDNIGIQKGLKAYVSKAGWSYIINDKGNAMASTLMEWGSCTPVHVLQDWIDKLPKKRWNEIYKKCDKSKDIVD